MSGTGSITKRCSCPPAYSPSGQRLACKLPHGSWSLVVGVRDPVTGRRRQVRRSGYKTKAAAQAALAELVDQAAKGTVSSRRSETFAAYATQWLGARTRRVRPVTALAYSAAVRHATATFGGIPVSEVTRADVERLTSVLADAGRSQRTLSFVLFVVRSVLAQAVEDGLCARNIAAKVQAAGRPPVERGALSADNLAKLRAHVVDNRLAACWLLTLYGLRRSEVLGLRWDDVDLSAGTVTVARGVVADAKGGRAAATPPKTRRGHRVLPLPSDLLGALRTLREDQAAAYGFDHARSGWLAVDEAGVPLRPERWSDAWRRHCQAAGVPVVTLHAARHSSVSLMRAAHVPDDVVARWHGHDEVVMRRTYSHPDADALASAGQALAGVLAGGR